jgi:hypothetical protein
MFPDPDVWRWGKDDAEPPHNPYRHLEEEGDEDGDPDLWEDEEDEGDMVLVEGEMLDEMEVIRSYITQIHHRL